MKILAVLFASSVLLIGLVPTASSKTLHCNGHEATTVGTSGNDNLDVRRGLRRDIVSARPGQDIVRTGFGDDLLCGGGGNDMLFGGRGDDVLKGGRGHDTFKCGPGNDVVILDVGDDQDFGAAGADCESVVLERTSSN